jgi:hypothetical protein
VQIPLARLVCVPGVGEGHHHRDDVRRRGEQQGGDVVLAEGCDDTAKSVSGLRGINVREPEVDSRGEEGGDGAAGGFAVDDDEDEPGLDVPASRCQQ